jgi:NADH-quinone oxidoreductase subunit N
VTFDNLLTFSPQFWLLLGVVACFLLARLGRARMSWIVGLIALGASLISLLTQLRSRIDIFDGHFVVDAYSLFFQVLLVLVAGVLIALALVEQAAAGEEDGGFSAAILGATLGATLIVATADVVTLFIGVIVFALSLWLLLRGAMDAGGGTGLLSELISIVFVGAGFLLLIAATGRTGLRQAGAVLAAGHRADIVVMLALVLVLAGVLLRTGLPPFQWWASSRLELTSMPVAALLSSIGLIATWGMLGRLMGETFAGWHADVTTALAILAAAAMLYGILAAFGQLRVKSLLALGMISEQGFLLAALIAYRHGLEAFVLAVAAFSLGNLAALGALAAYEHINAGERLSELAGMSTHDRGLALTFGLGLASIAGLPPLAGFFGKFLSLTAAVGEGYAWLVVIGALNIVLSAVIFARIVRITHLEPAVYDVEERRHPLATNIAIGATAVAAVGLAVFFSPLSSAASAAAHVLR